MIDIRALFFEHGAESGRKGHLWTGEKISFSGIMARLARITPVDVAVHITQRGNNRQLCFVSPDDHAAYICRLKEYSLKYWVDLGDE